MLILGALSFASGEPMPSNRTILKTSKGHDFEISLFIPDQEQYPDHWYTLKDPVLSNYRVKYLKRENSPKGLTSDRNKTVFYFKATETGETNISFYS